MIFLHFFTRRCRFASRVVFFNRVKAILYRVIYIFCEWGLLASGDFRQLEHFENFHSSPLRHQQTCLILQTIIIFALRINWNKRALKFYSSSLTKLKWGHPLLYCTVVNTFLILRRDFWILKSWVELSLPYYLPSCLGRGGVNSTQLYGTMNSSKISPL